MDSILNWIGGKSNSCKKITELIPDHFCYVEAFAGACVHPDTLIDMEYGLLKKISDVRVNDIVLTHKGNYKRVTKIYTRNYDGDIYVIKALHTFRQLIITPEHPILVMQRSKTICSLNFPRANSYHKNCPYKSPKCNSILNFTESRNVNKSDYFVYPIHKMYDNDIEYKDKNKGQNSLSKYFEPTKEQEINDTIIYEESVNVPNILLNEDFLELCGFYLAEGSFDLEKSVQFSFNTNEIEYIESVTESMKKYFDCDCKKRIDGNSCDIKFFSVEAYRFFKYWFNEGARNKFIHRFIMELPISKLSNLLRTYIYGDGCFVSKEESAIQIKSVSYNLMNQIKILFNRMGIITSLDYKTEDEINEENKKYSGEGYKIKNPIKSNYGIYILIIHGTQCNRAKKLLKLDVNFNEKEKGSTHGEINNNYVYYPVHSVEKFNYKGKVYNLEVEDDNSYVASGFCVHNCWVFFEKPQSKVECINDVNGELINFWRVMQKQSKEFIERSKYEMYSRELYEGYYKDFDSGAHAKMSNLERAFRFFCMIKEAFASKFKNVWGYGQSRNQADAFFNEFLLINKIAERMKHVQIENRDFEKVINGFDSETTLFMFDPPYVKADVDMQYFKSMGANNIIGFGLSDHQRLYKRLTHLKGKFILTIDDSFFVRERYCQGKQGENGFWWIDNTVFYSSAGKDDRKHITELIITNYDTTEIIKQNKLKNANGVFTGTKSLMDY